MRITTWTARCLRALRLGALAPLLIWAPAHATLYRIDFTAVIDAAWYTNDPSVDGHCAYSAGGSTYDRNNCEWSSLVGQLAYGGWYFDSVLPHDLRGDYSVVIPFLGTKSIPPAGGDTVYTMTDTVWRAGADCGGCATDIFSQVEISPGGPIDGGFVPDLSIATSSFVFSVGASASATDPGFCPLNDTSLQFPGFPVMYGTCKGQGHVTSIAVSLVPEPDSLVLAGAGLLGLALRSRRRGVRRSEA